MRLGSLRKVFVQKAVPPGRFFGWNAIPEKVSPYRQNLMVYPLAFHLNPTVVQVQQTREKGPYAQAVVVTQTLSTSCCLLKMGAEDG